MSKKVHRGGDTQRRMPAFTISVASRLSALPIHTIRWIESNDLVKPARTRGNRRLFSEEDIDFLREIAELLERKVNLAGIRTILTIKERYEIDSIFSDEEDKEEP